jgi:hypothetical protein
MRKINALLIIGITGSIIFGIQFTIHYGRTIWGNKDMWWTPMSMALPLSKTDQKFKLFLKDELLQDYIKQGALSATGPNGKTYCVATEDFKIRLNNWNKTKASFLQSAVFAAFFLGISITCLILGITQFFSKKRADT